MVKKLYFSIGISGSGKSYFYKNRFLSEFEEVSDFLVEKGLTLADITVSPDDIRREVCGDVSDISQDAKVWKLAETRLQEKLKTYGYGVFDATGVSKNGRKKFLKNYKNVHKTAIVFEPNVSLSKERIKKDINEGVDRSKVPMFVIDRQFESFKSSIMCGDSWNGVWDKYAKEIAYMTLKKEFEDVFIV
jgi:predicted kinase